MFKSYRTPSRRDRPQDSVVIMGFKCKKLFSEFFFSLFTIFHLWLTLIRCQEPINGLPKMSLWSHFFSQKTKAMLKGGQNIKYVSNIWNRMFIKNYLYLMNYGKEREKVVKQKFSYTLFKFSWRTKLPHPHPESQSTSRSSLFAIPIQYGGIGRRGDRCRRYFRLSASIKFKRLGWWRSQR